MSASSSTPRVGNPRQNRLYHHLEQVISGKKTVSSSKDGDLFLEAICSLDDPTRCITKVISGGLPALQASLQFNTNPTFLNGKATALLQYLQVPVLKTICGGDFLQQVITHIVDPPIFWDAFIRAFKDDLLDLNAQKCFGWLLLELVSLPSEKASRYTDLAQETTIQKRLLESPQAETRKIGQRIKHIISSLTTPVSFDGYGGPGGRHDNDVADFRQISILPTADELLSKEKPFLRQARAIEECEDDDGRLAIHLDNQFRLLREDMVGEVREELQIALGVTKKRHRGVVVDGFDIVGVTCGSATGGRVSPWCLQLRCKKDLPQLHKFRDPNARKKFVTTNKNLLKHNAMVCLIVDGESVAFPTINRDEDLLATQPPTILLQFTEKTSISINTLIKLKRGSNIKIVVIDTAVFAYEPILLRLQEIKEMQLRDELLSWKKGVPIQPPPSMPNSIIQSIRADPSQDLSKLLGTSKPINLDTSQSASLLMGLTQKVTLIQGPPGTGKSFLGSLLAKIIHDSTDKTILLVCFTNHALDMFLEDLLNIGIPAGSMVRLGGKSTARTKPLALSEQYSSFRQTRDTWKIINELKTEATRLDGRLTGAFDQYMKASIRKEDLMEYLEFSDNSEWYEAFTIPGAEDGMTMVDRRGRAIGKYFLLDQWLGGRDAGPFQETVSPNARNIWAMSIEARSVVYDKWELALLREQAEAVNALAQEYRDCQRKIERMFSQKNAEIMRAKRVVAATTNAACRYVDEIQAANPGVLLVEEAGEILESHILTALGPDTEQMILIGDHKQLRPKVNNYPLTVEHGSGYDLNRSLFERLVLKGFPHQTLSMQHRMRPEISMLVRELTYPDLVDAPKTIGRPNIRGLDCGNLVFVSHSFLEDNNPRLSNHDGLSYKSSKQNTFEAQMVLKCVRYLGQQGYGTDKLVVLTPYLGQLQLLREVLSKENDPVLNDLDTYDLVRAGLLPAASAKLAKNPIRISSIDNYQGEESDIVVITMTRSNENHDIGFMSAPERLNVLLSRARDGMIMFGNPDTFLNARKGKELWNKFFKLLKGGGYIHDGLPVRCERHPNRKALLRKPADFDEECPDGGCKEPCETMLSCGIHQCPHRCHQLADHSKMLCEFVLHSKCPNDHPQQWKCHKPPPASCQKCEREAAIAEKKRQRDFELQQKRDEAQREHQKQMALLDEKIDQERQKLKDHRERRERERALEQKKRDLEDAARTALNLTRPVPPPPQQPRALYTPPTQPQAPYIPPAQPQPPPTPLAQPPPPRPQSPPADPSPNPVPPPAAAPPDNNSGSPGASNNPQSTPDQPSENTQPEEEVTDIPAPGPSPSEKEWQRQKDMENASNAAIDSLMQMTGLENVKSQFISIKSKIDTAIRQNTDFKKERFGVVMQGNPGTGKTTVARLYARFLNTYHGVLPGCEFVETTGSRLANDGVPGAKKLIEDMLKAGGGAFFLDEAYQLTEKQSFGGGQVLDFLLAEIENNIGKIAFIFAGYNKPMEKFFEHNPGLKSRIPYTLQFDDYKDPELHLMLRKMIDKWYSGKMKIQGGMGGLYMRIAVRRLGRGRGREGFGNARDLENVFARIRERQGDRLARDRRNGLIPDDFLITKEDLIGPNPSEAILESEAWTKLQELIGLDDVKLSVRSMIDMIETNYTRELREKEPMAVPLNRVFLGSPGTGKTSVAKLYGRILADLGLLSNGEVVTKNPSDFIGSVLGESESNTKAILATTVGKVLIIDEAYMLYSGGNGVGNQSDPYKTAVIDTIVAEVQSTPGEDRCVLLLGYEEQITTMFQNVNPGLARRFAIEDAFHFQDFTNPQLRLILELKLKHQQLYATEEAKDVACELLGRSRIRPNFGNGGEVENIISQAKVRYQTRQSKKPPSQRPLDVTFEPQDFDMEFNRTAGAATNIAKLFEDIVGCEEVIEKLKGYQQIAINAKAAGMELHELIPTTFIFKGPPGTGKTTTARKMGQVYYDMGFLSSPKVVECSATDLIGQYVGHTGPKTQKQLEKALGQVLFVDEAYRLAEGHFATEAVNELVDILTKPKFLGKIVVILAGYEADINRLLAVNSGLSSRFPEEVLFVNMSPEHCLQVLEKDLKKKKINAGFLKDPNSDAYLDLLDLVRELSALPNWGNARDMKTMAKTMIGIVYKAKTSKSSPTLSAKDALDCAKRFLAERQARVNMPVINSPNPFDTPGMGQAPPPPPPSGPAPPATTTRQATRKAPPKQQKKPPQTPTRDDGRDSGVSDEVWNQLQADKAAEEQLLKRAQEAIKKRDAELKAMKAFEEAQKKLQEELALKKAKDDAELAEFKRKQEEARLAEQKARLERERVERELERMREMERKRKQQEALAQQKLREMGVCPAGYRWIKQAGGYRCTAGGHFVSNGQLGF